MDVLGNLGQKAFNTVRDALDPVVQASQPVTGKPIIEIPFQLSRGEPETKEQWRSAALNRPVKHFVNAYTGTVLGIEDEGGLGACGQELRDKLEGRQKVRSPLSY
jgi:hypothetical protein